MLNFNMGALRQWQQVGVGEVLDFPVPNGGSRHVAFDLVADSFVRVHAVSDDSAYLVAAGSGIMAIKFATDQSVGIVVSGEAAADVFVKTWVETQVIPESRDPSYTSIEPRPSGPDDQMRRMMHIVRVNQERREQMLRDEIDALRGDVERFQADPKRIPDPPPVDDPVVVEPVKPDDPGQE